jgi:hypothetical protein
MRAPVIILVNDINGCCGARTNIDDRVVDIKLSPEEIDPSAATGSYYG